MPHSQGLSNNPYPWAESTQFLVLIPIYLRCTSILSSHLRLGLAKSLFHVGIVTVKILKALLASIILTIWPAHLNLIHLITMTISDERYIKIIILLEIIRKFVNCFYSKIYDLKLHLFMYSVILFLWVSTYILNQVQKTHLLQSSRNSLSETSKYKLCPIVVSVP